MGIAQSTIRERNIDLINNINSLGFRLSKTLPINADLVTEQARLDHSTLNARSLSLQTVFLSIIIVILVTITFTVHLKNDTQ